MRPVSLLLAIVTYLALASANAQELLDAKPIAGTVIKIFKESKFLNQSPDIYDIFIGDHKLYVDRDDEFVDIQGIYEASGHSYALIGETGGGSSCAESFRAIDLSARILVSKSFGTCSDHPLNIRIEDGKLTVTLPEREGKLAVFRYAAGMLTETDQTAIYTPFGPAQAEQNDIARLVDGKNVYEAVNLKAVAVALERIMGTAYWTKARVLVRDNGDIGWGECLREPRRLRCCGNVHTVCLRDGWDRVGL